MRLTVGNHRVQLNVGDGAVIPREKRPEEENAPLGIGHAIMVRVEDADTHCACTRAHGAGYSGAGYLTLWGERQFTAIDIVGHLGTFTQPAKYVHPEAWGGTPDTL